LGSSTTLTPPVSTFSYPLLALQDRYGQVALHHACDRRVLKGIGNREPFLHPDYKAIQQKTNYVECVKALLGAGADINKQKNDGYTPLMLAARWGRIEVVRELLKRGAKKDLKDNDGKTAYDRASNEEIKALLR